MAHIRQCSSSGRSYIFTFCWNLLLFSYVLGKTKFFFLFDFLAQRVKTVSLFQLVYIHPITYLYAFKGISVVFLFLFSSQIKLLFTSLTDSLWQLHIFLTDNNRPNNIFIFVLYPSLVICVMNAKMWFSKIRSEDGVEKIKKKTLINNHCFWITESVEQCNFFKGWGTSHYFKNAYIFHLVLAYLSVWHIFLFHNMTDLIHKDFDNFFFM